MTDKITGFKAYHIYVSVKTHFNSDKYDLREYGFLNEDKYRKAWNEVRAKSDGHFFKQINDKYNKKKDLLYLFAIYMYFDMDYVIDIINDDYTIFERFMKELENIEKVFRNDLLSLIEYCKLNKITLKNILETRPMFILENTLKLSVISIIILDILFKFTDNITCSGSDLARKLKMIKVNKLLKLESILESHLSKINWKEAFKQ